MTRRRHRPDPPPSLGTRPQGDLPLLCRPGSCRHLGYPDQARQRINEALILAQELAHPFSLVFALNFAAALHQLLLDGGRPGSARIRRRRAGARLVSKAYRSG